MSTIAHTTHQFRGVDFQISTWTESTDRFSLALRRQWGAQPPLVISSMILRPGEFFLDLGANVGTFCIPLAMHRGSRFVAFEAHADNYKLLVDAIGTNGLDPAAAKNFAVWSHEQTLRFTGESAYGQVDENGEMTVSAVAIDAFREGEKMDVPGLVKLDVEGAELRALHGMKSLLRNRAVRCVVFEGNGAHCLRMGHTINDLLAELENYGFICYVILDDSLLRVRSGEFIPFAFADYVGVRDISVLEGLDGHPLREAPLTDEEIVGNVAKSMAMTNKKYGASVKASFESRIARMNALLKDLIDPA